MTKWDVLFWGCMAIVALGAIATAYGMILEGRLWSKWGRHE